jgi:ribosomal protein L15
MPARFEGGRQPLIRQLPKKRGFSSLADKATAIKLDSLSVFKDGDTVTVDTLRANGLVPTGSKRVKILQGKLARKLTFKVQVSATAKETIVKAGGTVV